jgi:peroxiredoxin
MRANIIVGLCALAMGIVAAAAIATVSARTLMKPAPAARFTTLSGETFSTAELRGKVVLVNFWATWCTTCVREMPKMVETWRKYSPQGYDVVAVAVQSDHPNQVADFAQRRALPFKVALDSSGDISRGFGDTPLLPESVLIDRRGRIVARFAGEPEWAALHAAIEKALGS